MSHIFISYSTKNGDYARKLAEKLREEGFDVWIDKRRLHSSEDWWRSIVLALRGASVCVVILSPESDASRWVQREITLAEKYEKPLFPLLLEGDLNSPNWELFVRTQVENVIGGELPPTEFYDYLEQHAPRRRSPGADVTAIPAPAPIPDSEIQAEIAHPPPSDVEDTTAELIAAIDQVNVAPDTAPISSDVEETPTEQIASPMIEPEMLLPSSDVVDMPTEPISTLIEQPYLIEEAATPPLVVANAPDEPRVSPVKDQEVPLTLSDVVDTPAPSKPKLRFPSRLAPILIGVAILAALVFVLINNRSNIVCSIQRPGQIAFVSTLEDRSKEIYLMNANGGDLRRLTQNSANDESPAWSADGSQIAFSSDRDGNYEIYVMNADGSDIQRLTSDVGGDYWPTWSADGSQIAFSSDRDGNNEIYVMNADGSEVRRLTQNGFTDGSPAWSANGLIAFYSDRDGNNEIYVMNPDGSEVRRLTQNGFTDWSPAWSADGNQIAFSSDRNNSEVYAMNADGSNVHRLTQLAVADWSPTWSPDGRLIVFRSDQYPNGEIHVMNADGSDNCRLTTTGGNRSPAWRPT